MPISQSTGIPLIGFTFMLAACSPLLRGEQRVVTSGDSVTPLSYYERLAAKPSPKDQYLGGLGMLGWADQCVRASPAESAAYRRRAIEAISAAAAGGWPQAKVTLEFLQRHSRASTKQVRND
jgi:hypothetical protein